MKKTRVDDDDYENAQLIQVIGKGSFNCAHLVKKGDVPMVMRVGMLRNKIERNEYDSQSKGILRGLHVLSVLSKLEQNLGPSLLKEYAHTVKKASDLKLYKDPNFCDEIYDANAIVAVQYIEYLRGGYPEGDDVPLLVKYAFMLLWFIQVSQKKVGFCHRDLKKGNIVVRNYENPQVFQFRYQKKTVFTIETRQVPVFIDFDFSSFAATGEKVKLKTGTYYAAPPEALLWIGNKRSTLKYNELEYKAYDYWSIAICILDTRMNNLWDLGNVYLNSINSIIERQMTQSALFTAAVLDTEDALSFIPEKFVPYFHKLRFNYAIKSGKFLDFKASVQALPKLLIELLSQLLSWSPEARVQNYILHPCFNFFKRSNQNVAPSRVYTFDPEEKPLDNEELLRDYKYIATNVCANCEQEKVIGTCPCCRRKFCSRNCQKKTHAVCFLK